VDKPSEEDKADLEKPFLSLHTVSAWELGCSGAARALAEPARSSAAAEAAQGSDERATAQASHGTDPAHATSSPAQHEGGGEACWKNHGRRAAAARRERYTSDERRVHGEGIRAEQGRQHRRYVILNSLLDSLHHIVFINIGET